MDTGQRVYEPALDLAVGSLGRGKGIGLQDVEGTRMAEITGRSRVLGDTAPATWSGSRYVGPPVLVARWGLVVVAAMLWLTVVPLVATASDLRRAFTR